MSAAEVAARTGHAAMTQARRAGLFTARRPGAAIIRPSSPWLHEHSPADPRAYIDAADRVMAGRVTIFALQDYEIGAVPEWNRDPLTGTLAPLRYGPSIDVHSRQAVGDIKYLWEPNRHLDLVVLAQAFSITNDRKYVLAIRDLLESWLEQCPYLQGANWNSGLELAIRLINWSVIWQLTGAADSPLFAGEDGARFRERWLRSIYQHVHFVRSHYSRFSSANNHLVGEAAGVFVATCTWPYWKDFDAWGEQARRLLLDAAEVQTHDDGVNREQAVAYQQFVLDFFILAALAGRCGGRDFPQRYWQRVETMIEYLQGIMDVRGNVPMIGDADDGYAVRLARTDDFCPYRSLLATGALLFGRADFAARSGGLDDKTRYLLGSEGWAELASASADAVKPVRRQFPDGGYYVLGEGFNTANEIRLLADAGPLGYLSIAAHGHADALAVCLSVSGREFLVDPGTLTYHGDPELRRYFRGTSAHNTVTVDDQDQSLQAGSFLWRNHAQARCTAFTEGDKHETFVAEHDGYQRLDDPLVHERRISRDGARFDIEDTLRCRDKHSVQRAWHFSERCRVTVSGAEVHAENDGAGIVLTANDADTEIVCLQGSEQPFGGWVSRRFDVRETSTSIYFIDRIKGTASLSATIRCRVAQDL